MIAELGSDSKMKPIFRRLENRASAFTLS